MILDAIGHIEAIGVGHYLAERGRDVTVVTPLHSPLLLDAETMQKALPRAVRAGVRWRPNTAIVAIGDHEVTVADVLSYAIETLPGRPRRRSARTASPNDALYRALRGRVPEVVRVGDAVVGPPRRPRDLRRPPRRPRALIVDLRRPRRGLRVSGARATRAVAVGGFGRRVDAAARRASSSAVKPRSSPLPRRASTRHVSHVLDRAAVHLERLAGDARGLGRREEAAELGDVHRIAEVASAACRRRPRRSARRAPADLRGRVSRRHDRVRGDAVRRHLGRDRLGERVDAGLGRDVVRLAAPP